MSDPYADLLDATVSHLNDLKTRGVRHVAVSAETWAALKSRRKLAPETLPRQSGSTPPSPAPRENRFLLPRRNEPEVGASPPPAPPVANPSKVQAMAELRERALACVKCPNLVAARRNVVFGVGSIDAQLMFVGEAPGMDEDAQGEPFVGAAGHLLTKIIQAMGLTRETVYIANILKCRPDTPGQASGNRKPTPEEMQTCIPYLHAQVDLIQPKVLVALGGTAVEGLLGKTGITRLRGHWQSYREIPLMPTFHPSFLLRPENAGKKREVWQDMLQVMERLELPISDKQRGFFQRAGAG
jgi:DNA polymerase